MNTFLNPRIESTKSISMQNFSQNKQVVTLKALVTAHIEDFMEWATDDEVTKYMMWNSYTSRSEAELFFTNVVEKHPWIKAISLNNKVIGSITLDKGKGAHSCKAELGYVIARNYWGKGFVTQAIQMAIQKGFEDLDIMRIEAYVDPANIASQRVLEKNGFEKEVLLKNYIVQKGVVRDRLVYAFLKPTY